jgi:hypothetical protein
VRLSSRFRVSWLGVAECRSPAGIFRGTSRSPETQGKTLSPVSMTRAMASSHDVISRHGPLAGVRHQQVAFWTHIDQDADQIFTIIGSRFFKGSIQCVGVRIATVGSSPWPGTDFNKEQDNTVRSVVGPFWLNTPERID